MKSLVDSDPAKAYEIFQSLTPEAQNIVPQDVVNKMVAQSHEKSSEGSPSYDDLDKKSSKKKEEGKSDVNEGKTSIAKTLIKEGFSVEDANAIGSAKKEEIAAAVKSAGIAENMVNSVGDLLNLKPELQQKIAKFLKDKSNSNPLEGKHYKDMSIEELRQVAKLMKVKHDEKTSLAKLRTLVGDAIIDAKIQEAIKKRK